MFNTSETHMIISHAFGSLGNWLNEEKIGGKGQYFLASTACAWKELKLLFFQKGDNVNHSFQINPHISNLQCSWLDDQLTPKYRNKYGINRGKLLDSNEIIKL